MSSSNLVEQIKNTSKKTSKGNTIVITGGHTIISQFGPETQILRCPYCKHMAQTIVRPSAAVKTHLMSALLCMCCCWLCSCCPYLIQSCMDRSHYCGNCHSFLGKYRF
ncbi:hypothetical protein RN001_010135 [Aquatica leii]|uniref:LITAF domain-containing protein n=1 Tax=Aquatica leii TaxID=1421715 RepID=A0AAN7P611_9COLE|nr:hypothetical protein RN001_010135 [Aquatica leii]